jgi:hypothetical protein
MQILVSGLGESDCSFLLGGIEAKGHQLCWLTPSGFFDALANTGSKTKGTRMVWLYRAPWSPSGLADIADSTGSGNALEAWANNNRALLSKRTHDKCVVLLANADRVSGSGLEAEIEHPGSAKPAALDLNEPMQTAALAKLFELAAPRYWDIFEALEGAAWTSGTSPIFRSMYQPEEAALQNLLRSQHESRALPHIQATLAEVRSELAISRAGIEREKSAHEETRKQLAQARDECANLQKKLAASRADLEQLQAAHGKLRAEHDEAQAEGELLLVQLHQVQEELEQYYLKGLEQDKLLEKERKSAAEATRKADSAQKEIAALKLKLRQLQEELTKAQAPPVTALVKVNGGKGHLHGWRKGGHVLPPPLRRAVARTLDQRHRKVQRAVLVQSGWFNPEWYLDTYPDLRAAKVDPVMHYLMFGWKENRNPCPGFDTAYYLATYPDVRQSGVNPLWHYLEHGSKEGRLPRKP